MAFFCVYRMSLGSTLAHYFAPRMGYGIFSYPLLLHAMSGSKRKNPPQLFDPLNVTCTTRNLCTTHRRVIATSRSVNVPVISGPPKALFAEHLTNEVYNDYVPANPITAESLGIKEKLARVAARNLNSVRGQR